MDKTTNHKGGRKKLKNKHHHHQPPPPPPLKVVYITNPIKLNATPSEFRSLVQELTGQDADYARFAAAEGVGGVPEAAKVAAEESADVAEEGGGRKESELSTSGSYNVDGVGSPEMIDNFEGLAASSVWNGDVHYDVFKTLDAM